MNHIIFCLLGLNNVIITPRTWRAGHMIKKNIAWIVQNVIKLRYHFVQSLTLCSQVESKELLSSFSLPGTGSGLPYRNL